jgi:hypothetical protein
MGKNIVEAMKESQYCSLAELVRWRIVTETILNLINEFMNEFTGVEMLENEAFRVRFSVSNRDLIFQIYLTI